MWLRRPRLAMDLKSLSDFGRKLDFGFQAIATEFRSIASFSFGLGLLLLFIWYVYESVRTLWAHHEVLAVVLALGAVSVLFTFGVLVVIRYRKFENAAPEEKEEKSSFLPFLLLNFPFVAAVGLVDLWCGHRFTSWLLGLTQELLRWIARRFS
jgi:formate hydrogenlyase subunit 3/multisubunit Na+/H+ antiporter MnhD subunit